MILAIIQGRMSSRRLPGKILKEVCGKPLLELLVERLRFCDGIDEIVVATTTGQNDDPVEELAEKINVKCFRGSESDVLDRFYQAAKKYNPDHVVRITADCPLIDPKIVQQVIDCYLEGVKTFKPYHYVSNTLRPTFPDGLDVEVFSFSVLEKLNFEANEPYQREHVTTYIVEHADQHNIKNVVCDRDLSRFRWTVDTPEDFKLIEKIYEGLYANESVFHMEDILKFLDHNLYLNEINKGYKRNEGFIESLNQQGISPDQQKVILNNVFNEENIGEI